MRDTLPSTPFKKEIGILNLDSYKNLGTHWTLWYKNMDKCYYFDSFGLGPPKELITYLKKDIWASTFIMQEIGTKYCGHLCIILLKNIIKFNDFWNALLQLNYSL